MDVANAHGGRLEGQNSRFCGKPLAERTIGTPACARLVAHHEAPSDMWHGNLNAIVASHQDAILGSTQVRNADRQPYADRQKGDGEGKSRHVRQHAVPVIVDLFPIALIARQIVGHLKLMDNWRIISVLSDRRAGARPKLEHAVLFFWRGRYDGLLGSHGCQLRGGSVPSSMPTLHLEEKIG
jgi:hypothetical protein